MNSSSATTVDVAILPENLTEGNETVIGQLSNIVASGRNVIFTNNSANGTITNDDATPVAINDSGYQVDENRSVTIPANTGLLANDTDSDDGDGPSNLTAVAIIDAPDHGIIQLQADGGFTFTPTAHFFGNDSFTYQVSDGTNTAIASAAIVINELNVSNIQITTMVLQPSLVAGGDARDTFQVTVTNNGPDHATAINLSQILTLPAGVSIVSQTVSLGTILNNTWSLDLTNGQSANVVYKLQAADTAAEGAGVIPLSTQLVSLDQVDETPVNNLSAVSASIVKATEVTTTTTPPQIDFQSGLLVVNVTITNNNATAVDGARIYVNSLPSDTSLHNGSGTRPFGSPAVNTPYVLFNTPIAAGTSIQVPVTFYRANLNTNFTPGLHVELLSTPEVIPVAVGNPTKIFRIIERTNNDYTIEVETLPNGQYRVEYSDDLVNWIAVPSVVLANTNRTFWTDDGAPKTRSHPSTEPRRFYRVFLLPTP